MKALAAEGRTVFLSEPILMERDGPDRRPPAW